MKYLKNKCVFLVVFVCFSLLSATSYAKEINDSATLSGVKECFPY